MYLLYLDEAGVSRKRNHFILGGGIIHEDDWLKINKKITNLKLDFFNDVYVDLKGLRRWKYKKIDHINLNPFYDLSIEKINEFSYRYYNILGEGKITFIASVINRKHLNLLGEDYNNYKNFEYIDSYKFLIERFNFFLREKQGHGTIHIEYGNNELSKKLKQAHNQFIETGTDFQQIDKIIECCNFVSGPKNNFIQISDLFISSLFSGIEYNNYHYYEKHKPYIRCSENGKIIGYGIKYHPKIFDMIDIVQLENDVILEYA